MHHSPDFRLSTEADLAALYAAPMPTATRGTLNYLHDYHLAYLRRSPLVCIASSGPEGLDVSPRGGEPGFVQVLDRRTLAIPDFPGNNKIETLRNLVRDERVALLVLFPGLDIFLRIAGRAAVTRDPPLLERLAHAGKRPITAIVVGVELVYFHCGRAINRAKVWDPATHVARDSVPSPGTMMRELCELTDMSAAELDAFYERGMIDALY